MAKTHVIKIFVMLKTFIINTNNAIAAIYKTMLGEISTL